MGKGPGRDITGKWPHAGGTVVYFILKLNRPELCLCADSKVYFFEFVKRSHSWYNSHFWKSRANFGL